MKKSIITFVILFLVSSVSAKEDWKESKSNHFVVYYKQAPEDFVKTVMESAEEYYEQISRNLGVRRYQSWTWDQRASIYIFDNVDDYVETGSELKWSHGMASIRQKTIRTFPAAHGFFDSTLPHELTHIIFRELIGYEARIPLWFEEGVAMYQEKAKRWGARKAVQKAIAEGKFIPLK